MLGKILIRTFLLLTLLISAAQADDLLRDDLLIEGSLPAGVVNTALADFGMINLAGDYGQGNTTPVEIVGRGTHREVRIFRSPEFSLTRRRNANMQVLLGNLRGIYIWMETSHVQGDWHLAIDLLNLDGNRTQIYNAQLNPGVRYFVNVFPHTRVDCRINTKTTSVKYNRRFILNVSPLESWARWPEFLPVPYRTIF